MPAEMPVPPDANGGAPLDLGQYQIVGDTWDDFMREEFGFGEGSMFPDPQQMLGDDATTGAQEAQPAGEVVIGAGGKTQTQKAQANVFTTPPPQSANSPTQAAVQSIEHTALTKAKALPASLMTPSPEYGSVNSMQATLPTQVTRITPPENDFWSTYNVGTVNGIPVAGTNQELWQDNLPGVQDELRAMYASGRATFPPPPNHTFAENPSHFDGYQTTDSLGQGYLPQGTIPEATQQTSVDPQRIPLAVAMANNGFAPLGASYANSAPAGSPTAFVSGAQTTGSITKKRKRTTAAPPAPPAPAAPTNLEPWAVNNNLTDATSARDYLARHDTLKAKRFTVPNDDVDEVREHMSFYADLAYRGIFEPYNQAVPQGVDVEWYHDSMGRAYNNIKKRIGDAALIKAAKACGMLVVDAAISIHVMGMLKQRYQKWLLNQQKNAQPDLATDVDPRLQCSERVLAMIEEIKANKLVAKDVLEQKGLLRFAEEPAAYGQRKFKFANSNVNRQVRHDKVHKTELDNGIPNRARRVKRQRVELSEEPEEAGEEGYEEDVDFDDYDGEYRP